MEEAVAVVPSPRRQQEDTAKVVTASSAAPIESTPAAGEAKIDGETSEEKREVEGAGISEEQGEQNISVNAIKYQSLAIANDVAKMFYVDSQHLKFNSRSMCNLSTPSFQVKREVLRMILQFMDGCSSKDTGETVDPLSHPWLAQYVEMFSPEMKERTRIHLRNMVNLYRRNEKQGWIIEMNSSNNGTRLKARSNFKKGDIIAFLEGQFPSMEAKKSFFKKNKSRRLIGGPLQYAEPSCNPNGEIVPKSDGRAEIRATRAITEGEEICVEYGDERCSHCPCRPGSGTENASEAATNKKVK